MKKSQAAFKVLYAIYNKHRRKYKENYRDSKQMCLMWSTDNPPDIIEGTEPFIDIEETFDIFINDEDSLELYDMELEEASKKIIEMQKNEKQK